MIKNILKEVIIILLLCVVITLLLGVILYDYNPIGKVVPSKIAYTTPENIAEELKSTTTSNEKELTPQNKVYTIDGSDLSLYKKSKAYNPSKENPFADTTEETTNTTTGTTSTSNTSSTSSTSNAGTSSSNSGSSEQTQTSSTSNASTTASTDSGNQTTGKKAKLK